jgi:hypothetical protein
MAIEGGEFDRKRGEPDRASTPAASALETGFRSPIVEAWRA